MRIARRVYGTGLRQGSILIITLWSLCFLTSAAVYLGIGVRQKINLVQHLSLRDELYYIAEAGIKRAMMELKGDALSAEINTLSESWSNSPGSFSQVPLGQGSWSVGYSYKEDDVDKMRYGFKDEESKINLNKADINTITRLVQSTAGLEEEEAKKLAYCIVDWRDKDSSLQHPQYGAEDKDYRQLKAPYECKDADFEVIEEMLLVWGMTAEIFDKIKDYVTIYGEGQVNINTASSEVLSALGLNETIIEKIIAFRKGDDAAEGTPDDKIFTSPAAVVTELNSFYLLSPAETDDLNALISNGVLVVKSGHFMITSSAKLNNREQVTTVTAIVDRKGNIKRWRSRY